MCMARPSLRMPNFVLLRAIKLGWMYRFPLSGFQTEYSFFCFLLFSLPKHLCSHKETGLSGHVCFSGIWPVCAGDKNYPWKTRTTSTYDIALPDGTGDEEYLSVLEEWLPRLFADHRPQLVFYQAGVDAMEKDSFGRCPSSLYLP